MSMSDILKISSLTKLDIPLYAISYNVNMIKKSAKIILFDTLGVLAILLGLILSPFPGPWTIPLYIIGLSLFAKNHHWAKRIVKYFRERADELIPKKYVKPVVALSLILFLLISTLGVVIYYSFK